eukprot:PhF_6_TR4198/c0_g1_i3/m.5647
MPPTTPIPYRTRWSVFRRDPTVPFRHPKQPLPPYVKTPFLYRSIPKTQHHADLDTIEVRGMYKDELCIQRGKFPKYNKMWLLHTDGAMSELDVEYMTPPIVVLYRDRLSAHKELQENLMKANKLRLKRSWLNIAPKESWEEPSVPMCNMMEFPYCVPSTM